MELFLETCQNPGIYEHLLGHRLLQNLARSDLKKKFFAWLYGKPGCRGDYYQPEVHQAMWDLFPDVCGAVEKMKRHDYRELAREMQRVESQFVIDTVCRRLMLEHPALFVTTIHDSISTIAGSESIVMHVFREEFDRIGLNPILIVE